MTKVRVQDATKELSANAGKMLESVTRLRKQSQDVLSSLRKISDGYVREEKERQEREAKEELRKQYEASAQFMTAYSSEQVPEVSASDIAPAAAPEAAKPAEAPAAPKEPEKPVVQEAPAAQEKPVQAEAKAEAPRPAAKPAVQQPAAAGQPRYGRPVQPGQQPQQGQRYGRPVQPGQQPQQGQPRYGRPVQPGQQPQPGQRYGRPVQPGQPAGQAGGQRPFGRPAQPGQAGGQRPFGRPAQPGQGGRAGGFGGGSRPGGFGRGRMADLAPAVEKERVSNYDPNKKQYVRQNDPERNANRGNRRRDASMMSNGYDDEFVRGKKKKKAAQKKTFIEPIKIEKAVMTAEKITVRDLTERIGKPAGEIIKKLMMLGIIATINNELDYDTASLVASEFGVELELKLAETAEDALEKEDVADAEEDLMPRPPVVTIMGHVDHGKTSLLDYIRKAHVTATEAGGITQHIGAYTVDLDGRQITFLDTPGHEAFTSMRMRGAQATDIAVLVVAADDGVMPQTVEAISHAKAAGVQIIVAINKIDKVGANIERIKQQLTEYELVCEEWGGDTIMVPVSAVTGEGVDQLLEMILLVAEVQDYRANPNRKARGIIIEARLDKGRGPVATVLVKNGTLRVSDTIVAGTAYGRVRAMVNDRGERVKEAGPSQPVEVIGFNDVPEAGDIISAVDDDKLSRQVAEERKDKLRRALIKDQQKTTLDDLFSQISAGQIKDLNLIIKADVQGSVEAVRQSLEKLSNDEVRVRTIHGGVGAITETDVMLASTANAIIIGFNVRPDNNAREMAEREKIDIRLYRVIYQAIEDVENAMKGMLAPKFKEVLLGHAQVRQTFKVSGVGTIAGSYVTDGKIARNAQIRLLRDNVVIHEGKIDSLKRFKDDAKEVNTGYECGIGIENYNDIKENDVIECFVMEEVQN
ncbi:MAG TPA: translation initiation factor IF-2 [Candidatus Faecivicinus avistercoris]|nr:translation initiation factor IF-2 [Candidatus Faecivicinus avistercoris]